MKKRFVLLFCVIFSFFIFDALAQENKEADGQLEKLESKQKVKYWDNWFVSAGGTANLLFAEEDKYLAWSDRIKLGGEFSLGKWFNPFFGMRLQLIGGKLRGYNLTSQTGGGGVYTRPDDAPRVLFPRGVDGYQQAFENIDLGQYESLVIAAGGKHYTHPDLWRSYPENMLHIVTNQDGGQEVLGFFQEFNYLSANVDLMFNFSNLMRGFYSETGKFDVIGFAGGGLIQAFDNKLTTPDYMGVAAKIGGRVAFNLNPRWAIYLEPQVSLTFSEFDGYIGNAPGDAVFNAAAGIQYTFNRNYDLPPAVISSGEALSLNEINYLNEKINSNRAMLEKHQSILDRHQDLLDRLNQCCEENGTKIEREVITQTQLLSSTYLPEYVRFTLNSTQIQFSEEHKFKEAVEFLQANPSSKLLLVGYADKKTGTSTYNYELSRKRVEVVSEELIRRGIEPDRLILEWRGDKEQPYVPNDWNRVVIMVER
jgi:outer membrane protein OmpA-like peptidoglycan-associated protein